MVCVWMYEWVCMSECVWWCEYKGEGCMRIYWWYERVKKGRSPRFIGSPFFPCTAFPFPFPCTPLALDDDDDEEELALPLPLPRRPFTSSSSWTGWWGETTKEMRGYIRKNHMLVLAKDIANMGQVDDLYIQIARKGVHRGHLVIRVIVVTIVTIITSLHGSFPSTTSLCTLCGGFPLSFAFAFGSFGLLLRR